MLIVSLFGWLSGCTKSLYSEPSSTDPLNLTGQTGRNLTLEIKGLEASHTKSDKHTVCAIGLPGISSLSEKQLSDQLVCESNANAEQPFKIRLKDLPYPAYITIFHDENNNRILDFADFNIIVIKETGPAEGIGVIQSDSPETNFSKPIWVEVGETTARADMTYQDLPFWKVVKKYSWDVFFSLYLDLKRKVNREPKEN
jgi:hypothetical protein